MLSKLMEFYRRHPNISVFVSLATIELVSIVLGVALYYALDDPMRERFSGSMYLLGNFLALILFSAVVLPVAAVLWARRHRKNPRGSANT